MDNDLISKKELLELTGISYGQLYRWKRKNLIPEEWFIRKSAFTGQETFFPRDKILERVKKIKDMKEDLSLDDLAEVFSPDLADVSVQKDELLARNIVSEHTLDLYTQCQGDMPAFGFEEILRVYALEKTLQSGEISQDEGRILLQVMADNYRKFEGRSCELIFARKLGISTCLLALSPSEIYFEQGTRVVARLNLAGSIEELKIKIG